MHTLLCKFKKKYKEYNGQIEIAKSPLRICPLGAHVDHQEGLVTGMALDSSIDMVFAPVDDGYIRVQSLDFPDEEYFHVDNVPEMIPGFWGNYLRGSILSLKRDYLITRGFNAIISGKLPIGGLSSSAAVTTAYLLALCDCNGIEVSREELIQYSHWVETDFIGLKNGILDQASNILSKDGYLMYMDCKTGEYELVKQSAKMPEYEVLVVYSGISTALMGTDYNNRVDECKVSAWILQELVQDEIASFSDVKLRDIDPDDYKIHREKIPGRFRKRADHYFSEFTRAKEGVQAWENGDIEKFGRLMFESGESSVHNYQCGCPELISIFEILKKVSGVYGARFSGAGYRGCCIGLINPAQKEFVKERIDQEYPLNHPEYKDRYKVHFCKTDDGARIISDTESGK